MPWDIKWKTGKLLVSLTAVHWNILNGGVIVFLISSAWVCVYLFTCSVNKDSVCCDPLSPPHTQLRMKNPFELWEQPQNCLCWRKEHHCSLNRQFKDTFSAVKCMDFFPLWTNRWAHVKSLNPPLRILLWAYANGNVQQLGWTDRISVLIESHIFFHLLLCDYLFVSKTHNWLLHKVDYYYTVCLVWKYERFTTMKYTRWQKRKLNVNKTKSLQPR